MNGIGSTVRAHVGAVALAGMVVVGGAGVATAVALTPTAVDSPAPAVTDPATVETTAPTVTEAPAPPVVADAPADTVGAVTTADAPQPAPAPAPDTAPEPTAAAVATSDPAIGTIGPNGNYTPAPPKVNPGEPPVAVDPGPAPAEKLPGEPGYEPPTG